MLSHGFELCWEYTKRYGKQHTCEKTLNEHVYLPQSLSDDATWQEMHINDHVNVKDFVSQVLMNSSMIRV